MPTDDEIADNLKKDPETMQAMLNIQYINRKHGTAEASSVVQKVARRTGSAGGDQKQRERVIRKLTSPRIMITLLIIIGILLLCAATNFMT